MTTMTPQRAALMADAKRMYAAGWKPYTIWQLYRRRGHAVSANTVKEWCRPELAAKRREAQRRRKNAKAAELTDGRMPTAWLSPEWRLARMRALDRAGLSARAIARVMSFDFPDSPLTEHQVRNALANDVVPRPLRRLAKETNRG